MVLEKFSFQLVILSLWSRDWFCACIWCSETLLSSLVTRGVLFINLFHSGDEFSQLLQVWKKHCLVFIFESHPHLMQKSKSTLFSFYGFMLCRRPCPRGSWWRTCRHFHHCPSAHGYHLAALKSFSVSVVLNNLRGRISQISSCFLNLVFIEVLGSVSL